MTLLFPTPPAASVRNVCVVADFAELLCLRQKDKNLSIMDVTNAIDMGADAADEDSVNAITRDAFREIQDRISHCGTNDGRYPFKLNDRGTLLTFTGLGAKQVGINYVYLLLATNLNMGIDRRHAGSDGALLFEELSMEVGKRYLGAPSVNVEGMVFGTARFGDSERLDDGAFETAIKQLCESLEEGFGYLPHPDYKTKTAKDDKLDVVVWTKFADRRPGKLIAFGQCKTGTSWASSLSGLQPPGFCGKWFRKPPAFVPIRLFFVADRVPRDGWSNRVTDAGLLFDRCRIVEYANDGSNVPEVLSKKIVKWTKAAASSKGLRL